VIGWDAPLPGFSETIMRSVVLGSIDTAEAAQQHADLVITPSVQGIGLTEFGRLDELRAQGAQATREVLASTAAGVLEPLGVAA
jgi:predicted acylesterase/phospholipase RssA